jgi:hypothetical protein
MEIVIVLVGTAATALSFWLLTRRSRRERQAIFDEIRNGPSVIMTLKGDGTVETEYVPPKK